MRCFYSYAVGTPRHTCTLPPTHVVQRGSLDLSVCLQLLLPLAHRELLSRSLLRLFASYSSKLRCACLDEPTPAQSRYCASEERMLYAKYHVLRPSVKYTTTRAMYCASGERILYAKYLRRVPAEGTRFCNAMVSFGVLASAMRWLPAGTLRAR